MPVINFKYSDLCGLIGKEIPQKTLVDRIPMIGADMGDTGEGEDGMSVEFFPNRPDMFSVEGIARGMRAFLDIEPGMKEYKVYDSEVSAIVDESVKTVRPFFMCAVVKDLTITDDILRSMMEMQEKLHITIGRKRSKLAIGIHDLDKVKPPFTYKAVDPHSIRFVPLAKTEEMDLDEILSKHEKGRAYAHLLKGMRKYPIITDRNGDVLSFPPIINGALTAVTTGTRNVFIDVTGTDGKAVEGALSIVATALAERGGRICKVSMKGGDVLYSPDLTPTEWSLSVSECSKFLGIDMRPEETVSYLRRMGMDAVPNKDTVRVRVPATRIDVMHKVDLFEDVAIGYGFDVFGGSYSLDQTVGHLLPDTTFSESMRDVMIGLGFMEVTTLTLSNPDEEFRISGLPEVDTVRLLNPITEEHTCLRSYLMPSLMRILRHNKHRDLPQRIFEIGYVVRDDRTVMHICAVQTASRTSFTEIKSTTESMLREMGCKYTLSQCDYPAFIEGRGAMVIVNGKIIGFFGEVAPKVVTDFDITHPVTVVEIDLSRIIADKSDSLF
jgi:phenylalanyl-tRNA synthetase beta chain